MSYNIAHIAAQLPLFQALDSGQMAQLLPDIAPRRLGKGEVLFLKGDRVTGMYIVAFGQIKLALQSAQGEEKIMEIIGQGQSFGEAVMFIGRPFPVMAEALAESLVLHVPRERIDAMLAEDVLFARRMLAGLSMRLHSFVRDVKAYSLGASVQRVIGYLLRQCPESGDEAPAEIVLPVSKHVIASRLNLAPETLSRVFTELMRVGLIRVDGRKITVTSSRKLREYGL